MIFLLIASLIWAWSFGIIKENLVGMDPNFIAFSRLLLSTLIFAPLMRLKGISKKDVSLLALIGAIQYGLMYIAYIYSFQYLKAYEVALFTILTPLYITILDDLQKRRFFGINLATSTMAVIGAAVVLMVQNTNINMTSGFLIVQISNVCFAFGQIYYKKIMKQLSHIKDEWIIGLLFSGGMIITGIVTFFASDIRSIRLNQNQLLSLVYLGIVASGVGFFFWNFGARRVMTGTLAVFNNLKIPLSIAVSIIFFHESASRPGLIIGSFIIILALVMNHYSHHRRKLIFNEETGV